MLENRDSILLERILESAETAENYLVGFQYNTFSNDKRTYDAVLMQLVNIGEMVNRLSPEFVEKNKELPWHQIIAMRNQITHGYFQIKTEVIWKTVKEDLPLLKKQIEPLI